MAIAVVDDAGRPVPTGTVGEVAVRGDNVTPGYLNNPAANAECFIPSSGFFRSAFFPSPTLPCVCMWL